MSERLSSYLVVMSYGLVISKMAFLNVPAIIIGVSLLMSAAVAWIDRKQCSLKTLETLWCWKLRENSDLGVSYSLLVPLAVLLSTYHAYGAKEIKKDVFLQLIVSECMAMMVSYTMFSYLAVTEREIKDQAAVKKPEFRDTQIVNLSFYVLMSLMTGLFIAGYFLSWLGWSEFAVVAAVLFTSLISVSQLPSMLPKSFSLGEAAICCQALTIFLLSFTSLFLNKFDVLLQKSEHLKSTPDVIAFMEVAMASCLLVLLLLYHLPFLWKRLCFYALVPSVMALFSLPMLYICLKQDFVLWLIAYISQNTTKVMLFYYWAGCLIVAIGLVLYNTHRLKNMEAKSSDGSIRPTVKPTNGTKSKNETGITTATRKQFHLLALAVIIPGIHTDVEITGLSLTCALIVFLMVESMRVLDIPPCGHSMGQYLLMFVDQQDQGPVLLTPIYLLVGCSLPLWLFPFNKGPHLCLYSGILSLGVGDTIAAVVGSKAGNIHWFNSKKTVEGTVANILAQIIALNFLVSYGMCHSVIWPAAILAITVSSLIEALTSQIDNLILPLVTYVLILAL